MSLGSMAELLPCPFCGGEAEVHYQPIYMDTGVCIRCTKCRARSKLFPCDCTYQFYHGEKNVFISKERATNDAINLWNTRTPKERGRMKENEIIEVVDEMASSVCRYHDLYCNGYSCMSCYRRTINCDKYHILYKLAKLGYRKPTEKGGDEE